MMIIDTPFHVTFSSFEEPPVYACSGKCKKVFWLDDMEDGSKAESCEQCGGELSPAVNKVHYNVLAKANRNLKISDFKKYGTITSSEKKTLQDYLARGAKITHLSSVKPKFEQRAKDEWLPNGLKVNASIHT